MEVFSSSERGKYDGVGAEVLSPNIEQFVSLLLYLCQV